MNDKNYALAVKLRHQMHMYPEISNHETNTIKLICDFITKYTDFKPILMGKYFYIDYRINNGEYIAFRTDIDALPMDEYINLPHSSKNAGISHKCGHDGHAASMFAFLLEVAELKPHQNILFIFQHAEETGDGAKECVKLFDKYKVKEIFGYHNMSTFGFKQLGLIKGIAHLGSFGFEVKLTGRPSHASEPEKGVNPVFTFANLVANMEQLCEGTKYSIVQLQVGQEAYGINASDGVLRMTIRSDSDENLQKARDNIINFATKEAKKLNMKANFKISDYFPVAYNHSSSIDKLKIAGKNLGLQICNLPEPFRASEDFGVYTKVKKGAIFFLGNGEDYPSIHTAQYDFRDELIKLACDIYLQLLKI